MNQEQKEALTEQHNLQIEQDSHRAAVKGVAQEQQKFHKNPEFLKQLQDPDVDSELWDWLEDEIGPPLSGSHILGQRDESYEEQQSLLNRNKVQRMVAERTPGRLLKENPRMLAQAQGVSASEQHPDPTQHPEFREPLTSRKERVLRDAAEVITTRQTMSIGGRGVDAVSTATVENRTVTNEQKEASGVTSRAKEVFK